MTQPSKHFSKLAVAAAAAWLLTACGGTDPTTPTDTTPPTVAITDSVTAATATAAVTFTFTFSEDVGTTFAAEDITVTGGTAGSLVKVSATVYTLLVTPPADSSGSLSVSVAAGKFKDIALNDNTAAANAEQAFDTRPAAPTGTVLVTFDETTAPTLNNFGGTVVSIDNAPAGGNGKAMKIVRNGGEPWAGAWVPVPAVPTTPSTATITARVYSPTAGIPMVAKLEWGDNQGSGDRPATGAVVAGWQTLTWTFPNLDATKVYNRFVILPNLNTVDTDKTYYIDDITLTSGGGGGGGGAACGTTEPTCAPATAIPADAVTIYSDTTTTAGFDARPNWGQTVTQSEVTIAGNKSLKYTFQGGGFNAVGAYEGLEWAPVDVSTKGRLRMDLWSADMTTIRISLISPGGKENAVNKTLTAGAWNSLDIDLAEFPVANKTEVFQIKLESATAGTLYVDNIHFAGTASTGGGGGINPNAAQGSAGPVTIPVLTAADTMGFAGVGDALFAGDYVGKLDANNNHAGWESAVTRGAAANGNIGYFQDVGLSTSPQKLEENGWIASLLDNPNGVPSLFRFFILRGPAATFASSYMGLYVNAPNNGTVNISSYGSIKFRAWGPAEMYQRENFNPQLEITLTGAKVEGCTATGSGGTEIKRLFTANQKIGAASTYKVPLAAWTVVGVCGTDTQANAVASVLSALARVVVTVPGTSFNFTNINADNTTYATGLNLGPIAFTNN